MHVRLTSAQLQGIFTTGSATSARSATIEGTTEELTSRAEAALTKLPRARVWAARPTGWCSRTAAVRW